MSIVASLGLLAYEPDAHLFRASLEDIARQTLGEFELVVVDDASTRIDVAGAVAETFGVDRRVRVIRNGTRRGMAVSSQFALEAATSDSKYFAWVSDHDRRHPEWLEALSDSLDHHSAAVLAYPQARRVAGSISTPWRCGFETAGLDQRGRIRAFLELPRGAGYFIYGLIRRQALDAVGGWPRTYAPDVVVVARLLARGHVAVVERELFVRIDQPQRITSNQGWRERQRSGIFVGSASLIQHLPVASGHLLHVVRAEATRPLAERRGGAILATELARAGALRAVRAAPKLLRGGLRRVRRALAQTRRRH